MKRIAALLLVALGFTLVAAPVVAQDGADLSDLGELEVLTSRTRDSGLIEVTVAVPGALAGRELPPSAVAVFVDGLQKPLRLDPLPNDELDIVLAIDISGSMEGEPLAAAKDAAASFVRVLPPSARVSVIGFDDEATVVAPFGSTAEDTIAAVRALQVDGDTAVYDAVDLALDQFSADQGKRRTVVLLTDGKDTASAQTLDQITDRLTGARTDVYAVALLTEQTDLAALRTLVAPTEGRVVTASDTEELTSLYDNIAAVLGSQYRIIFDPLSNEGGTAGIFMNYLGVGATALVEFDGPPTAVAPDRPGEVTPESDAGDAAPSRTSVVQPSGLEGDTALLLGTVFLALALAIVGLLLFWPNERAVRLASARDRLRNSNASFGTAKERATDYADRFLEHQGKGRVVGLALERAGVDLRPGEFVVLVSTVAVAGAMLGFLLGGIFVALVLLVVSVACFRLGVTFMASRRSRLFEEQLPSTLQLMAGSLRAGYALPQAAEAVANESPSPTADEFHRLVTEHRLGRDLTDGMYDMIDRVQSDDFRWVVQAIAIHREVGGDLAEVLDNVNSTIRDRNFIRRQFAALSAEGRYSAYLIVSLPFIVFMAMTAINPEYTDVLYKEARGQMMLGIAALSLVIGSVWMRRLIRVRY